MYTYVCTLSDRFCLWNKSSVSKDMVKVFVERSKLKVNDQIQTFSILSLYLHKLLVNSKRYPYVEIRESTGK